MKRLLLFAMSSVVMFAAAGTVTVVPSVPPVPASPGKMVITAGALNCTVTPNAAPATSVSMSCAGSWVQNLTMPMTVGGVPFQLTVAVGGDIVSVQASQAAAGAPIAVQAAATPNGGTTSGLVSANF